MATIVRLAVAMFIFSTTAVELVDDPPLVEPRCEGVITGRLINAKVVQLHAVRRSTKEKYTSQSFDPQTGEFAFAPLPADATYDLVAVLEDGRIIEGIDLEFVDERLNALASLRREYLGMTPEPRQTFTTLDSNAIKAFIAQIEDFMDIRRALYIRGIGDKATVLVELLRVRSFYASESDEVIWRVELWYFQRRNGLWERVPNAQRVLERQRTTTDQWKKIHHEYYPELSVRLERNKESIYVEFTIPPTGDASRGRIPGTDPKLKTDPHVIIE